MSKSAANDSGVRSASPPPGFVHLHLHSEYSFLDGACKVVPLLERCLELGMPAVAVTDHGVLSGSVELYREAIRLGVKPVIGFEAYLVNDLREKVQFKERRHHLSLLAENDAGYRNLRQISSQGFLEGYYYKPRIDKEVLKRHSEGIIVMTGCLQGRVARLLLEGDREGAEKEIHDLQEIFGDENVFIEVQNQGLDEQQQLMPLIKELAVATGRPLVATNDVHYLRHEDAASHDALLCIQTQTTLDDPKRLKFGTDQFFLKSPDEMALAFPDMPEALATTVEIADRCHVEMEFGRIRLPVYRTPGDRDQDQYLCDLCEEGLKHRFAAGETPQIRERLDFELATIREMGFASYFLIVWDFVKYARDSGIPVGPGRGSAAGSLVSYCLGITEVNPLPYDLLFERFLNPGRKSMPDIDIDVSQEERDKVLSYVAEKYGRGGVAQIITFSTLKARAAIKDAGRVMGIPYGFVDRIAKAIPEEPKITISKCLQPGKELKELYDAEPQVKQVIEKALPLEGLIRGDSIHAAGVVISDRPLTDYVPLLQKGDGPVVTQFSMEEIERLGLLKMDILGIRNLDIIKATVGMVSKAEGTEIDIDHIPLDDARTYEMLRQGKSEATFQLESSGMKESLRLVGPTQFEDLVALVALYRPGPMAFIPDYAKNKKNPQSVVYDDPRLKPIMEPTHGVAVYQEQLMEIAKVMAGFSPAEADDLRKAISKKKRALMNSLKSKFLDGCETNQVASPVAQKLWGLMEAAGDYSFNKSHAVGYALIAYQTAYLKANYPVEFMAATISSVMNTKDKVPFYVNVCKDMGIEVLPPDINESDSDFAVVEGRIRFGLTAVKNVGSSAIGSVIRERRAGGPFSSIFDFCRRVDSGKLNKKALESLVKCGALDSTGATRRGLLEVMPQALAMGAQSQQDSQTGQGSIFDLEAEGKSSQESDPDVPGVEFGSSEMSQLERETLGLFLSSNPLYGLENDVVRHGAVTLEALGQVPDKSTVVVIGMVAKVKRLTTKKGDLMAFVGLRDLAGETEVVVFSDLYSHCRELLVEDKVLVIKGRVDHKGVDEEGNREVKIIATEISELEKDEGGGDAGAEREPIVQLDLDLGELECQPDLLGNMKEICQSYPGGVPVILHMATADGVRKFRLGRELEVRPHPEFVSRMRGLFGDRRVNVIASQLTS